jgi:hypothetical protein
MTIRGMGWIVIQPEHKWITCFALHQTRNKFH